MAPQKASPSRGKWPARSLIWCTAVLFFTALDATAQQADPLPQLQLQLQQLKQQYADTTHDFEQRIAALEQQLDRQTKASEKIKKEETASAVKRAAEEAAKKAVDNALARYQGHLPSEPTYEYLSEADRSIAELQQEVKSFEFHGYLRSGYGLNSVGGQQVAFQAPGSGAKYRLGNEAETYGEFIFVNNWLNPDRTSDKAWMKTLVTVEANTSNSASYASPSGAVGSDQFRLREAYVQAGNVLMSQPDAKFWAGERYYRRRHIEIDDFYSLDMSGYGAGVEDLNVRFGKVALAYLAGARPDIVTANGNYTKSNIDVRLYGVKGPGGLWGGWFDFADSKGGTTPAGTIIPASTGYAFDLRQQQLEWHGGYHSFSVAYGTGAASNLSTSIDDPTQYVRSSARFLATEQVLFQASDRIAFMPIFVYQRIKDGNPQHGWDQWLSFGARPEVFFTKYLSLAFEAGFDHTHSVSGQYDGWLRKFTIAPQIGAGRKFESRPVLRVFLTYASWSDGLRGFVGGPPYLNRTNGLTFGVQGETWW